MTVERFTLDTNILVYSINRDAGVKQVMARRMIDLAIRGDCRLTLQAVSEFYAAATRTRRVPPAEAAAQSGDWLDMFPCLTTSPSAARAALQEAATGRTSYWDALILATAAEGRCQAMLTEDMKDGAVLGGVRIVNPFGPEDLTGVALQLLSA